MSQNKSLALVVLMVILVSLSIVVPVVISAAKKVDAAEHSITNPAAISILDKYDRGLVSADEANQLINQDDISAYCSLYTPVAKMVKVCEGH